jgi:hypothetical protein
MNESIDGTYRIVAPDFVVGLVVKNSLIIQESPRIRYLHRARIQWLRYHCEAKGWTLERIQEPQGRFEIQGRLEI